MKKPTIRTEPHVDSIIMPENLRVGLMVAEQRKKCHKEKKCNAEYYGFGFGQSPFHVPDPIARALAANTEKGHYSDAEGIYELRQAVAGFTKRHFKLDVDLSEIIIGPGTKQLIHMVFDIVRGDVIIPSPSWIGYFPQIKLLDKHFHTFYTKPEFGYKIQPDDLDGFLSEIHREQHILVLNNPHNPTGALYTEEELKEIADVCRKHNTFVLADEIYALTTYQFERFTSMRRIYPEGSLSPTGFQRTDRQGGTA